MSYKTKYWFGLKRETVANAKSLGFLSIGKKNRIKLRFACDGYNPHPLHDIYETSKVLNGYLDLHHPVCLYRPKFVGGGSIYTAQALIKNIHLSSFDEQCFTGFKICSPAFHAYINPDLIEAKYNQTEIGLTPEIEIKEPISNSFNTSTGYQFKTTSRVRLVRRSNSDRSIIRQTNLTSEFGSTLSFTECNKLISKVHFFFCFLVGKKMQMGRFTLQSNKKEDDKPEGRFIDADVIYRSTFANYPADIGNDPAALRADDTKNKIENIFEHLLKEDDNFLSYSMDMILRAEEWEPVIDDSFNELIGLLEQFHSRYGRCFTSAKSAKDFKSMTLLSRLRDLTKPWKNDKFRGSPDLEKIKNLRNYKAHGKGQLLLEDELQYIVYLLPFLTALLRYHLLKFLGFSRDEIAESFYTLRLGYGMFVPEDKIPR